MRGTAAILVCLISLHYLSVVDAYSARFTSENGAPGREHEDKHPRKSSDVKRSLPDSLDTLSRQYDYDSATVYYGGLPNVVWGGYRDADIDTLDADIDADIDVDTYRSENASTSSISKTLDNLLNSFVDSVRQLWGKLGIKPSKGVEEEPAATDTKRKNTRHETSKKRATDLRKVSDTTKRLSGNIIGQLANLADMAKKALDLAYDVIDGIDVSNLPEESQKLKQAIMELVKKAKDALEDLIDKVVGGIESGGGQSLARRTRSVGKRANYRGAFDQYMTGLRSQKRSQMRKSHKRSSKMNPSVRESDMKLLLHMMTKMEECISKMEGSNSSYIGIRCVLWPMMKILGSPKLPKGLDLDADFNVRSNKAESADNVRSLNFPWGSVFLIPIYDEPPPGENTTTTTTTTTPGYPDKRVDDLGSDNVTTTTTEPPTTTTEAPVTWPDIPVYPDLDKKVRGGSRYRSKYDKDF